MQDLPEGLDLEYVTCASCHEEGYKIVLSSSDLLNGIPGLFTVVRCNKCKLCYTNPRPTAESIGVYYPDHYGPYASKKRRHVVRNKIFDLIGMYPKKLPISSGFLYEVGCSAGAYLHEKAADGFIVQGLEVSPESVQKARASGLQVEQNSIESATGPDNKQDIVVAWMVLEHVHDPILALGKMCDWVKPNGYLMISVPDFNCLDRIIFGKLWYALQVPTHLYHYTPKTIDLLLKQTGWKLEKVIWQANCMNLLKSLYLFAKDRNYTTLGKMIEMLIRSKRFRVVRWVLSILLKCTRQSGRIEIIAKKCV